MEGLKAVRMMPRLRPAFSILLNSTFTGEAQDIKTGSENEELRSIVLPSIKFREQEQRVTVFAAQVGSRRAVPSQNDLDEDFASGRNQQHWRHSRELQLTSTNCKKRFVGRH
ncbi:hypothetical protein GJAV_G00125770 [Gymnothorax javanicus]|nr:hypothetical protein GJAV_G00125770 [Gymnothorax javanicus]